MTSSIKTELHAYAWDANEQPTEIAFNEDDHALQQSLMVQLETKEYGKFVRVYPGNTHIDAGELTLWYRAFTDEHRGRIVVSGVDEAERDASYATYRQYCTQRVFSPAELYALKPTRVDYGSWHTMNVHFSGDGELGDIDLDKVEGTKRMETRTIVDYDYDGRRGWTLQTVWFDNKPVMVVNSSGRDGDEYHDRWITDGAAFHAMIGFLRTFCPERDGGFVEASDKIPSMTEFYNHTIHDYYDVEAQEPKKK